MSKISAYSFDNLYYIPLWFINSIPFTDIEKLWIIKVEIEFLTKHYLWGTITKYNIIVFTISVRDVFIYLFIFQSGFLIADNRGHSSCWSRKRFIKGILDSSQILQSRQRTRNNEARKYSQKNAPTHQRTFLVGHDCSRLQPLSTPDARIACQNPPSDNFPGKMTCH